MSGITEHALGVDIEIDKGPKYQEKCATCGSYVGEELWAWKGGLYCKIGCMVAKAKLSGEYLGKSVMLEVAQEAERVAAIDLDLTRNDCLNCKHLCRSALSTKCRNCDEYAGWEEFTDGEQ